MMTMRNAFWMTIAAGTFLAGFAASSLAQRNAPAKAGDSPVETKQEKSQNPPPPEGNADQPGRRYQRRWEGARFSGPSPATEEALKGPASAEDWKKWEPKITQLILDGQRLFELAREKRRILYNLEQERRGTGREEFSPLSPLARPKAEAWIGKAHEAIEKVRVQQEEIRKDLVALLANPEEVKSAARFRLKSLVEENRSRVDQPPPPPADAPPPGRGEQGSSQFRAVMERRFEQRLLEQLILHLDEMARQPEKIEALFDYDREPERPPKASQPPSHLGTREQVLQRLHRLEEENRSIHQKLDRNEKDMERLRELMNTLPAEGDSQSPTPASAPSDKN